MLTQLLAVVVCTLVCLRLSVCLSVCLSHHPGILSKLLQGSSRLFAHRFHSTHATLCFGEIRVYSKMMTLPSGTLLRTLDLENLAKVYMPTVASAI